MKAKRAIGIFIILSIFAALFFHGVAKIGILNALVTFAAAVGVTLLIIVAVNLIYEE